MVQEELARVFFSFFFFFFYGEDDICLTSTCFGKLNETQSSVLCVYINFIGNTPQFCQKHKSEYRRLPKKILFSVGVGFSSDRKTFLGSDAGSVFDSANGALFENERKEIAINEFHSFTSTFNVLHRCRELFNAFFYPLQNHGDLCGVISIIMANIVCLSPNFAEHVFVTPYGSKNEFSYLYLSEPLKYGKHLRSFVTIWMDGSYTGIQHVVPTSWKHSVAEGKISSDSDDDINIPRVVNSFQHDSITILRMRKFLLKPRH